MSPAPVHNRDDPDKDNDEDYSVFTMESPQLHMPVSSSTDSDPEDDPHLGYQLLPQDPDSVVAVIPVDSDDEEMGAAAVQDVSPNSDDFMEFNAFQQASSGFSSQVPPTKWGNETEREDIWKNNRSATEPLNPDQADKIKAAMSGFHMPHSAVPDWARIVPEEDWKAQLFARLTQQQHSARCSAAHSQSCQQKQDSTVEVESDSEMEDKDINSVGEEDVVHKTVLTASKDSSVPKAEDGENNGDITVQSEATSDTRCEDEECEKT